MYRGEQGYNSQKRTPRQELALKTRQVLLLFAEQLASEVCDSTGVQGMREMHLQCQAPNMGSNDEPGPSWCQQLCDGHKAL